MALLLGGLALLAIGAVMLIAPQVCYQITQSWKNDFSGSPSNLYKLHTRIGGILFLLVGLVSVAVFFVA